MIESCFQRLKYNFLYRENIQTKQQVLDFLPKAIHQYNFEQCRHFLDFKTSAEVFHDVPLDLDVSKYLLNAQKSRVTENLNFKCCYSF